jgi:hypothetical protein
LVWTRNTRILALLALLVLLVLGGRLMPLLEPDRADRAGLPDKAR